MSENSYLALREAKIARNLARLQELGLSSTFLKKETPRPTKDDANVKIFQHATSPPDDINHTASRNQPLRRSKRKLTQQQQQQEGDTVAIKVTSESERTAVPSSSSTATNAISRRPHRISVQPAPLHFEMTTVPANVAYKEEASQQHVNSSSALSTSSFPPCSARAMPLNVQKLLHGNDTQQGVLGRQLNETGKAHVMQLAASLAVPQSSVPSGGISFNKYSGVQEWGNHVLFLWINLNAPNQVVNDFMDQGRRVIWYGGSRMHDGTAVIQTLKRVGSAVATSESNDIGAVILWCRIYDHEQRNFTPYTCLGRLSLHSYDSSALPLAFVWNLMDYQRLNDQGVLQRFIYHESDTV